MGVNGFACAPVRLVQVVWDLPNLKKGMRSLNQSRIAPMYRELSPKLRAFGAILAQSFEVQALIALVNCILTTIGLMFLKVAFYSPPIIIYCIITIMFCICIFMCRLPLHFYLLRFAVWSSSRCSLSFPRSYPSQGFSSQRYRLLLLPSPSRASSNAWR